MVSTTVFDFANLVDRSHPGGLKGGSTRRYVTRLDRRLHFSVLYA
ncbi:hypothetical protein NIES2104_64710 [Leptolyngbya sp. NIES-2104]|nr:hypothetical protein NIES2104_64710 [Leptolyngbya sp. NIES-2104]